MFHSIHSYVSLQEGNPQWNTTKAQQCFQQKKANFMGKTVMGKPPHVGWNDGTDPLGRFNSEALAMLFAIPVYDRKVKPTFQCRTCTWIKSKNV